MIVYIGKTSKKEKMDKPRMNLCLLHETVNFSPGRQIFYWYALSFSSNIKKYGTKSKWTYKVKIRAKSLDSGKQLKFMASDKYLKCPWMIDWEV